jgi:hypothetical protein
LPRNKIYSKDQNVLSSIANLKDLDGNVIQSKFTADSMISVPNWDNISLQTQNTIDSKLKAANYLFLYFDNY